MKRNLAVLNVAISLVSLRPGDGRRRAPAIRASRRNLGRGVGRGQAGGHCSEHAVGERTPALLAGEHVGSPLLSSQWIPD